MNNVWDDILSGTPSAAVVMVALLWLRSRFEKYLDSYMDEKGKTLARKEDINDLAAEVRILTKEAETIKAQLSQDNWDRQQRWSKRLACYVDLVDALHQYGDAAISVRAAYRNKSAAALDIKNDALGKYNDAVAILSRAKSAAELMCVRESLAGVARFVPPAFDDANAETVLEKAGLAADLFRLDLVAKARVDLGYDPPAQSKT
jgi:hypothetical protein